nr:phosphoethanolamine transferase [Thermoflavifilum aggregans]
MDIAEILLLHWIQCIILFHLEMFFSGAYFTYLSVPQMITRAMPGSMDRQFKEKSILSIFKQMGFETVWISNQDEDYYTESFTLHAETADVHIFPDDKTVPDKRNRYDEKYLPIIDSILCSTKGNIFLVFHILGNHWNYAERYPQKFDLFQPSGKKYNIQKPNPMLKQVIINSYDNSIIYTNHIISSVIQMVNKLNSISFVCYLSDHGEDLFDKDKNKLLFHLYPSYQTLHVPLFIWTSNSYDYLFSDKIRYLKRNQDSVIRSSDIFYTLVGMSNIRFVGFDSTMDMSSPYFKSYPVYFTNDGNDKVLFYPK